MKVFLLIVLVGVVVTVAAAYAPRCGEGGIKIGEAILVAGCK